MSVERTKLYVWGSDSHGQLGLITNEASYKSPQPTSIEHNIKRMACGEKHILFVNDQGACFSQGCNQNGELGINNKEVEYSTIPLRVELPSSVQKVFCGLSYSLSLLDNKEVYGWGLNEQGILGSFNLNISWKPIKIVIDRRHRIKTISCGALHCGFVTEEGSVLMCGSNEYGEIGFNRKQKISTPTELDISFHAVDIACGVFYTLLLDKQGKVYSFGNNKYGQLGTGTKQAECFPRKIKALENQYIVKVSAGYHSGALTNRGELFIWGSGTFGEHLLPFRVELEPNNFYVQFSIGGFFGAAIDKFGKVHTWGNNSNGELGQGNSKSIKNPTEVKDIKGIERIYCGHSFIVALPKQNNFSRSISETPKRIAFKNRQQLSPGQPHPRHYTSIQKAVSNFKRTVNELQSKEAILSGEKEQLQLKLEQLSIDYQKLSQKYQLIETIVSQKQRMIAIYQDQIRESNIRLMESSSFIDKYNAVLQENTLLSNKINEQKLQIHQYVSDIESLASSIDTYKRKFDCLANTSESLTQTNQSLSEMVETLKRDNQGFKGTIDTLKASERYLKSQVKNQKHLELQKGVEEIIKSKDAQIEQLIKKNQKLINENEKTGDKLKQMDSLGQQIEGYKQTICDLESSLQEKEDEMSEIHLQQQHERNIKKFTGFMCSPSERSDSQSRRSPIKIQCENRAYLHQSSGTKQQPIPSSAHLTNNNAKDLKRMIRQLQNQVISLNSQLQLRTESETKLQRQIQQQMLISAQLKEDIRELNGSLTLTESQHTNSKSLLSKYQGIISLKQQEEATNKQKISAIQQELRVRESAAKREIDRLGEQCNRMKERVGIIQERQKESVCIIRAQKRQIEDLKVVEADFDNRTTEYKKLLNQISDKDIQIHSIRAADSEKQRTIRELEEIIHLEREELTAKYERVEKELTRVTEMKDKLYENSNQLFEKNTEMEQRLHESELELGGTRCQLSTAQNRLSQCQASLEESSARIDNMTIEGFSLKKQLKSATSKIHQLQLVYNQSKIMLQNTTEELILSSHKYKQIEQLYQSLTIAAENQTEQIQQLNGILLKREKEIRALSQTVEAVEGYNKEYCSNESVLVGQIRSLEKNVGDLEHFIEEQVMSGKDMIGKNQELDRKNRELADMLNKAIEQQAIQYKHKIMSEVANNANMILENFNEESSKEGSPSAREIREFGCQITNRSVGKEWLRSKNQSPKKNPPHLQQTPEQKYNKLLSDKISENKKRISESANKLCELLDFKEIESEEKYSRINLKIEAMDGHKQALFSKIAHYAQKLKHL